MQVMIGCARGLAQCHHVDLLHRDLEPWNILFCEHYRPTVIDFGFSKKLTKVRPPLHRVCAFATASCTCAVSWIPYDR